MEFRITMMTFCQIQDEGGMWNNTSNINGCWYYFMTIFVRLNECNIENPILQKIQVHNAVYTALDELFLIAPLLIYYSWQIHNSASEEFADCPELIIASSQCIQKHVMTVRALLVCFPDCTNGIIFLLADGTVPFDISSLSELNIEAFVLMEAMLTHKVSTPQVSFKLKES